MNFFTELKRRNVFKAAASYVIVAWIVLQVADTTFSRLNIPDWVVTLLIVLFLLGLPVVLFVSWAFELTPEGFKPAAEVGAETSMAPRTGQRLNLFIVAGLVVAVTVMALDVYVFSNTAPSTAATAPVAVAADPAPADSTSTSVSGISELSVAVLPFADLSPASDQEYFADGLSEEILNKLAQVRDLFVVARTSSFTFKGRNEDMRSIGQQLGVNYILEGSVRKADNTLRITAQLIQADNGFHLWSETYNRNLEDVFAVQDDIARAVTRALSITLGTEEFALPGSTRSVAAFDVMLQVWDMDILSAEDTLEAISKTREVLRLDPNYARAWLTLYDLYSGYTGFFPAGAVAEFPALAEEALTQAAALAPDMPLLQFYYAQKAVDVDADWVEADRLLTAALERYGNSEPELVALYSLFLQSSGNVSTAIPYAERARRLDPLSETAVAALIRALIISGNYERALVEQGKNQELRPTYTFYSLRWAIAWQQRDIDEYVRIVRNFYNSDDYDGTSPMSEGFMEKFIELVQAGDESFARAEVARMIASGDYTANELAYLQGVANEYGDAQWMEEIRRQSGTTRTVNDTSAFDWADRAALLRTTATFKQRMESNGMATYWRTTGNWPDKCRPLPDTDSDFECF